MNTLRIIGKEFKQQIRDWKSNSLMILFPIVLIAILGAALSSAFSGMNSLPEIKALYTINSTGPVDTAFRALVGGAGKTPVRFSEASSEQQGKQAVKDAEYSAYVVVGDRTVELYRNERNPVEAGVVKSILAAFLLRFNAAAAVLRNGAGLQSPPSASTGPSYVETHSVAGRKTPSATDFYAITMLTLIIMYGSLFSANRTRAELRLKTGNRILSAPVVRPQLLWGKVIGSFFVLIVQVLVLMAVSRFILGAYWGSNLLTVIGIILAEGLMIVSLGVAVAYLLPTDGAVAAVINTMIPFVAFLGGTYVPFSLMGPGVAKIAVYSPLYWVNQALLGVIYDSDYSAVGHAVVINCAIAVIFVAVAAILSRREAYR